MIIKDSLTILSEPSVIHQKHRRMKPLNMFRTSFLTLLLLSYAAILKAQCSLACKANVVVSLPSTCTVNVPPDSILVNSSATCPDGIFVGETFIGGMWVNHTFDYNDVNQDFTFRARDLVSGNSCFGTIRIEDHRPPLISNCEPRIFYCEKACNLPEPTVTECDPSYTVVFDEFYSPIPPCVSPFTSILNRHYTYTDASGNVSSCTKVFSFRRRPLTLMTFPADITINVIGPDCQPWCEDANGNPTPAPFLDPVFYATGCPKILGYPTTEVLVSPYCTPVCNIGDGCNFVVTYTDVSDPICGSNRIIHRNWNALAPCDPGISHTQNITIITDGNPDCGLPCLPPTDPAISFLPPASMKFSWQSPGQSSCVANFQLQYRFRINGVWQNWNTTTTQGTSVEIQSIPSLTNGQWRVRTECNGTSKSPYLPIMKFRTPRIFYTLTDGNLSEENTLDDAQEQESETGDTRVSKLYPNPNNGQVTVELENALSNVSKFTVTDISSQEVYAQDLPAGTSRLSLDLSNLTTGLYFFRITDGSNNVLNEKVQIITGDH